MKLQKQTSRKVGVVEYPKYVTVIPSKIVEKLGWSGGEDLDLQIKGNQLILKKKTK